MLSTRILQQYIACPLCARSLTIQSKQFTCDTCKQTYRYSNGIIDMTAQSAYGDTTEETWDQLYVQLQKTGDYKKHFQEYKKHHSPLLHRQLKKVQPKRKNAYLEIGSGMFFLGQEMAKEYNV